MNIIHFQTGMGFTATAVFIFGIGFSIIELIYLSGGMFLGGAVASFWLSSLEVN